MASKMSKRAIAAFLVATSLITCPVIMTGCFGGRSSDSETNNNTVKISKTSYGITRNAVNNMVNGALKFTITDMQRRPMSTFAGASIEGTGGGNVSEAATNDIVVQIDVSYTWNVNTYHEALAKAGTGSNHTPTTLKELLLPGQLMYIVGEDADGNKYQSADVIAPSTQNDVNQLAINAQWDYNVLTSPLPETSVTKTGSFLMRIPSTARNLRLIFVTPMGGQEVSNPDAVQKGSVAIYELPLT